MRKAALLDKKPLTATPKMLEMAKKDIGKAKQAVRYYGAAQNYIEYESRFYFRACLAENREILEVDLFTRADLFQGRKTPRFRIFLDRERNDFISWNTVEEKWSKAKIDMLGADYDRYCYAWRGRNYASQDTINLVNRYLKTGKQQDVEAAMLDFQAKVRGYELAKKHRLITDIIDGYMASVPDKLPADWKKFINDQALEHNLFFQKEAHLGYCTHCQALVSVSGQALHNMKGRCNHCGCSVIYKSWKKQKSTSYDTTVSLLQKCTDGENYVYRQFKIRMRTRREADYIPEVNIWEEYRMIFRFGQGYSPINTVGEYEWGQFKNTGIIRWCEAQTAFSKYYSAYNIGYKKTVLYTANLKKLLKDTKLRYVPAADIIKSMENKKMNVIAVLGDMGMRFPYEAFWKMGAKQFVRERVERDGTQGKTFVEHDKETPKPWEYLKISKEDMKQAVRLDASDVQMRIIQKAAESGVKLTDEQILWWDKYMGTHILMNYFAVQTPHRIIRYLREKINVECREDGENMLLHLWTDYLDTAGQLHWNLQDRSIFFPQNIQRAHDEATDIFMIQKEQIEAEKFLHSDKVMNRNAREIKRAFCYRDDEFVIKVPGRYLDFQKEGHAQHNCVATYYDKAVEGKCIILFIRKRKTPNVSFCTVEIRNNAGKFAITQNRAAYNSPAPEDAVEFMKKALIQAQKIADKIAEEERKVLRIKIAG